MEVSHEMSVKNIKEIKILSNVRLIYSGDLNPIYSKENLHVKFVLSGQVRGGIICYLCLDGLELSPVEKNFIYPLFTESMNILIGKQISTDPELGTLKIKLSPPKLSMISKEINSTLKSTIQKYDLEFDGYICPVIIEYSIEALN